uniref:Uncharacterized protein n=1 Tax=Physcomitrium patens TaxID=3218 RepID=A0A2K1KLN7_PHYPA|nr:hypothetical protein PHYPA_005585 [Physcomitrium patens]
MALTDESGSLVLDQTWLEVLCAKFYADFYIISTISAEPTQLLELCLDCAPITILELEAAILKMAPRKAPGLDGVITNFY